MKIKSLLMISGLMIPMTAAAQDQGSAATEVSAIQDSGDIIVTAQRRSERLRDVPMTITALDSGTLSKSGVSGILDIQRVTPGLQLPLYGGFLQPSIRGISSAGAGLGDQSNVAVYVDGVYQPSMSGQLIDLPDVEQVQVLKGPQGTLYGQNAAGGAIIVTSITPRFDFGGRASFSYGNYDDKAVRGYVTGPLVDDVAALAVAASYQKRDGFRRDVVRGGRDGGLESAMLRGRLLVQLTDDFSATVAGYYSQRTDYGIYAGQPVGPGTPLGYALAGLEALTVPKASNPREFALSIAPQVDIRTYGGNVRLNWDLGAGTLSSTSALGKVKVNNSADADYTAVNLGAVSQLRILNDHFIQELNFVSNKWGRVTLSAGGFFMALKERYAPNRYDGNFTGVGDPITIGEPLPTPLFSTIQYATNQKRSYAAYAELGFDVTEALNLSLGGRYAYETQQTSDNYGSGSLIEIADPRGKVKFKRFTPRATLRYALDQRNNVYASYSQGFKSGYVNSGDPANTPTPDPVRPEKVFAYELGYKGRPLDGVSFNTSIFHYDYKDIQVYTYSPPSEFYQNAAAARIRGIEADISFDLAAGFSLAAAGTYLDAKYKRFPAARVFVPNSLGFGYDQQTLDASGMRMPRAPKFTGNISLNYESDLDAGALGGFVSLAYNSGMQYDVNDLVRQSKYATINAELSFAPKGLDGVRFVLWGKNLTDKDYLNSVLESQFVLGGSYADPRTYGGRVEFAF